MEIKFKKPIVPNFIRCEKGTFSLKDLSEEEVERYIQLYAKTLRESRNNKIKFGEKLGSK